MFWISARKGLRHCGKGHEHKNLLCAEVTAIAVPNKFIHLSGWYVVKGISTIMDTESTRYPESHSKQHMKNPIVYTTYTVGRLADGLHNYLPNGSTKKYVAFCQLLVYNMILYYDTDDWGV